MPTPHRSLVISASVAQVWSVVRLFDGLPAWHPVIASSALDSGQEGQVGALRRLTTADGGVIVERLRSLDDDRYRFTYAIEQSPFPIRDYVSTMRLAPVTDSGGTFIEWSARFDVDSADEQAMTGLFGDGVFGAGLAAANYRPILRFTSSLG